MSFPKNRKWADTFGNVCTRSKYSPKTSWVCHRYTCMTLSSCSLGNFFSVFQHFVACADAHPTRLPNLKCLGLDLDRFYTFAPISLASLRHASDSLTSITLKPSCGWTQFQLLERTPSLQKIHYISHSPFDHPTQLSHYSTPCPIAFKEITHTSMISPFGFRSLFWLLTYPEIPQSHSSAIKPSPPEINLLALLGIAPEDSILGSILSFAGSRIRRLHVE